MSLDVLFHQATGTDAPIAYTAQQLRGLIEALAPSPGVTMKNDLLVAQRAAGANMSVDVAAGHATVRGTTVALQGTYAVRSTAVVNVPIATADPANPRIDLIVAQVYDKQVDGGTSYAWAPIRVAGVPASSPILPAVPASALVLAEVTVPAADVAIETAQIKDRRLLNTLGDTPGWVHTGGNGQPVASGVGVNYVAGTVENQIGMDTNGNAGEIVVRTPGHYAVTLATRYQSGGTVTAERAVGVTQVRNGVILRRVATGSVFPGSTPTTHIPVACAGTARCIAGDVLRAQLYQNAGITVNTTDAEKELAFTGFWIGP